MSLAQKYIDTLSAAQFSAVAFAVKNDTAYHSRRVWFRGNRPQLVEMERTKLGRCTRCVYRFDDGSRVVFTWNKRNGARWRAE